MAGIAIKYKAKPEPKPAPVEQEAGTGIAGSLVAGGAPKVKVRYYEGAGKIVTFYLPSGEIVKVLYIDQKWLDPIIEKVVRTGEHKIEKRWGYSKLLGSRILFKDDVWIAEIDAPELLKLITSSKSWARSEHARRIVEELESLVGGE